MNTILNKMPVDYWNGKHSISGAWPWITPGAIITLERILKPDWNILECGCGGSTVFYSKRVKSVLSLESDLGWADQIKQLNLPNTTIKHCADLKAFTDVIWDLPNDHYDFVSVDAARGIDRLALTRKAMDKLKIRGWLMIDNYNANGAENFIAPPSWLSFVFDDIHWDGKGTKLWQRIQNV